MLHLTGELGTTVLLNFWVAPRIFKDLEYNLNSRKINCYSNYVSDSSAIQQTEESWDVVTLDIIYVIVLFKTSVVLQIARWM